VVDLVPYVKLTNNLVVDSFTALGALTFTVKGKYYSGSFGAQDNTMEVELALVDSNGNFIFAESGEEAFRQMETDIENSVSESFLFVATFRTAAKAVCTRESFFLICPGMAFSQWR